MTPAEKGKLAKNKAPNTAISNLTLFVHVNI